MGHGTLWTRVTDPYRVLEILDGSGLDRTLMIAPGEVGVACLRAPEVLRPAEDMPADIFVPLRVMDPNGYWESSEKSG